jgi:hypothetical protein
MDILIGNQRVPLEPLDERMERAFLTLYTSYFNGQATSLTDFEKESLEFFERHSADAKLHDSFFNHFSVIADPLLRTGQFEHATDIWQMALKPAHEWESTNKKHIHKGTPYYWLGTLSILKGDLDLGYLYFHQSLQEDIRTSTMTSPKTPGRALVTLDFEERKQAFGSWVIKQAEFVQTQLTSYCSSYQRPLTLKALRDRLNDDSVDKRLMYLFTYTLAKLVKLNDALDTLDKSDFAGQLELSSLFYLDLLIENLINAKESQHNLFAVCAAHLSARANLALDQNKLQCEVNAKANTNPENTIRTILDGTFRFNDGSKLSGLAADISIAYILRNNAAHNASSFFEFVRDSYHKLLPAVFNMLFLTIDILY